MLNMQKMMKEAQKLQARVAEMQQKLAEETVEATAGGGVVKVVATGDKKIDKIEISPEVVDPEDVEMLEDLVVAAVNEALHKVDEMVEKEMGKLTGGLNIPGMPGGLF